MVGGVLLTLGCEADECFYHRDSFFRESFWESYYSARCDSRISHRNVWAIVHFSIQCKLQYEIRKAVKILPPSSAFTRDFLEAQLGFSTIMRSFEQRNILSCTVWLDFVLSFRASPFVYILIGAVLSSHCNPIHDSI